MGLFSFFKKKASNDNAQVDWLNKVNLAYQRAFQVKNATGLADYLTRTCLVKMMERIRMGEKSYSGLVRYQHTNWVKGEVTPERTVWNKEVTYDQIKISQGIIAPVGDNCTEEWVVVNEDGVNKISEIRRLQ